MSAITGDTLATYGGPYANYGTGPIDPTTDIDAGAGNKFMASVSSLTQTREQVYAQIQAAGTGSPTLVAHRELWGNVGLAIPLVARSGVGTITLTYPASTQDEIPFGAAGYTGPIALNLIGGRGQARFSAVPVWSVSVVPTAANVLTIYTYSIANGGTVAIADSSLILDIWGF